MIRSRPKLDNNRGFTLVEMIVSLVVAGILAVFYFHFMGTAMNSSWKSVELVAGEAEAALLMEEIISDYTDRINNTPGVVPPPLGKALAAIKATDYTAEAGLDLYYVTGITMVYVTYASDGKQTELGGSYTSKYLKITIHAPGNDLTTILSQSRTKADDPAVFF